MLASLVVELGPWSWIIIGFILLAAEIALPGVFLLWIGIAAILTGTLSLQLWDFSWWVWQIQVLVFLVLSLLSVYIGHRIMRARRNETDQPLLNQRAAQLVGRIATLAEPISEGYGRVRIGETTWRVAGPDLPAGTRVRVVAARDNELVVEPA